MESFEEENLLQMVNDYIEADLAPRDGNCYERIQIPIFSVPSQIHPRDNHKTNCHILQEIVESRNIVEAVVRKGVLKHIRNKVDEEKDSNLKKWLVMCLKMDGHNASLCRTSWSTTPNCPGGDYEFIDIVIRDGQSGGALRLIVDIDFKAQFEVARPTSTYKQLCNILPKVFIGDEHKLKKIISILCSEAKHSLRERGLHIPPWRTTTYMQSKWFSKCHKVDLSHGRDQCEENPKEKHFLDQASLLSAQFSSISTRCY